LSIIGLWFGGATVFVAAWALGNYWADVPRDDDQ
jgi:hypothetical protein